MRRRASRRSARRGDLVVLSVPNGTSHDAVEWMLGEARRATRGTGVRVMIVSEQARPMVVRGRRG